jgi:hypothetical protein
LAALHLEVEDFMLDTTAEQGLLLLCHDIDVRSVQSGAVAHERVPLEKTLIAIYNIPPVDLIWLFYFYMGYRPSRYIGLSQFIFIWRRGF